jgi:mercuric ion transport protein
MTDKPNFVAVQPDLDSRKARMIAAGGTLGALAASTCCIVPLILFSLGVSGAWIGNLTALEPYKPIFIVITLGFLGYGYWMVYRKPKACAEGETCARPLPNRLVKYALWASTFLIVIALFWNWIAPVVAPILLGPFIVESAMSGVEGVLTVSADVDTRTALVIFDDAITNAEDIAFASTSAGYEAALLPNGSNS